MKVFKKLAAVALAAVMSLAVFTACDVTDGQGLFVDQVNKNLKGGYTLTHDPALDAKLAKYMAEIEAEVKSSKMTISAYGEALVSSYLPNGTTTAGENDAQSSTSETTTTETKTVSYPLFLIAGGSTTYEKANSIAEDINKIVAAFNDVDGISLKPKTIGYAFVTVKGESGVAVYVNCDLSYTSSNKG